MSLVPVLCSTVATDGEQAGLGEAMGGDLERRGDQAESDQPRAVLRLAHQRQPEVGDDQARRSRSTSRPRTAAARAAARPPRIPIRAVSAPISSATTAHQTAG